jgi:asparagine synthase (glutamine-hydrolysing)
VCGIVGVLSLNGEPVAQSLLKRMTDRIAHRGPDGEGHYTDGPVGLGHRRLAIIDLSPAGRQPMANPSGEVVAVYNGEVYNFQKLRVELEALGYRFHSQTDTEVVIHAYEEWGDACLERLNGMFAFAMYDRRGGACRLFLARDRYGVKPLYYWYGSGVFTFASEIKALLEHPLVKVRVDGAALSDYFTFQNTFGDSTLFEGIRLLPAGCLLVVDPKQEPVLEQRRYWDYRFDHRGFQLGFEECAEELHRIFSHAVVRQMVADVPVGAYLSGGMDSGSIAAVAARQVPRMFTFTAGFDLSSASGLELGFDERPASEVMANLLKTEHYEVVLHAGDMENVLPDLIWHLEDLRVGQCYPNFYVARLAGKFVKVVLSGGGGDELFAGYPWRYYRGLGAPGGRDGYYRAYYQYWQRLVPDDDRSRFFNRETYARLKEYHPFDTFRRAFDDGSQPLDTLEDLVNAALYFEIKTFLHGLFVVEDKVSMAHSLETRVPFMDNELVDFAMKIPPRFKLSELAAAPRVDENEAGKVAKYAARPASDGKLIMRKAMSRLIPESVSQRAKQGFSAPDASWFRGESIAYVNRLLGSPRARIYDFLDASYLRRVLEEHTNGRVNHRLLIWSLLSFEWWCRKFL